MTLFLERGYENVTVAEIAQRAGLTRRTFFNYFADKREIFFSGSAAFRDSVGRHLAVADADLSPIDAAAGALAAAGDALVEARRYARPVRAVIAGSIELQERDLVKNAALVTDIAAGLRHRGVAARAADRAAHIAVSAFTIAWEDAISQPDVPLNDLIAAAIDEMRDAICPRQ